MLDKLWKKYSKDGVIDEHNFCLAVTEAIAGEKRTWVECPKCKGSGKTLNFSNWGSTGISQGDQCTLCIGEGTILQ